MKSLLKLLAYAGKAIGISSPSDNARRSTSPKQKQGAQTSASTGPALVPPVKDYPKEKH
jgi:hypothetical protein